MRHPLPRIRMLDGFNEGWIGLADNDSWLKGETSARQAIAALVAEAG